MICRTWLLASTLFLLTACAAHAPALPTLLPNPDSTDACRFFFPRADLQLVHLIEFSLPGGRHGSAMGVTILHGTTLKSVLMTVEGFVLFAAEFSDKLTVSRAVPPFDKPGFARGMMEDIRTIFLTPQGKTVHGTLPGSGPVCRTTAEDGMITDILTADAPCLQLNLYSPEHKLLTQVSGRNCTGQPGRTAIPAILDLTSHQSGGYSLHMSLISAEEIGRTQQVSAP